MDKSMQNENQDIAFLSEQEMLQFVTQQMVVNKVSSFDTMTMLGERGVETDTAFAAIEKVENNLKGVDRKAGRKDMLWGAFWFIGGLTVTLVTYSDASQGGGRYTVAYGAIIFGLIQLIRGAYNSR